MKTRKAPRARRAKRRGNKGGRPPSGNSLHAARTRKEFALAKLNELEVQERSGSLVSLATFFRRYEPIVIEIVRLVKSSRLEEDEKRALLAEIAKLHE